MQITDFRPNNPAKEMHINILSLVNRMKWGVFEGDDIRDTFTPILDGRERIWARRETASTLSWTLVNFGTGTLLVVGGANRQDTIQEFLGESSIFSIFGDNRGINVQVDLLAREILSVIVSRSIPISTPLIMAGYSLGGCVCYYLAERMLGLGNPTLHIFTYGSPRPCGVSARSSFLRTPTTRYYAINDPVRSIPPHFSEAYSIWPLINQATRNRWNAQVQVPRGVCIDNGGVLRESEDLNPESGGNTIVSVTRYYLGLETDGTSAHSTGNYQRLFALSTGESPVDVTYPSRPRMESEAVPTLVETRRAIEIGVAVQEADVLLPHPDRQLVFTQQQSGYDQAYRVRHRDGIWTVEQDGMVIEVGPGKRAARRKAKYYNKIARNV